MMNYTHMYLLIPLSLLCSAVHAYNKGQLPVVPEKVLEDRATTTLPPCQPKLPVMVTDLRHHFVMSPNKVKVTGNDIISKDHNAKQENCTEEDGTSVEPVKYEHWKLHIIMGCTVTAAVEFALIIFIIVYWREIRWTLRKLTCPCQCSGHEAMEPEEPPEAEGQEEDVMELAMSTLFSTHRPGEASLETARTYSTPWNSRVQVADVNDDEPMPGPSGMSMSNSAKTPVHESLDRRYSTSDDSLSSTGNIAESPLGKSPLPPKPILVKNPHKVCRRPSHISKLPPGESNCVDLLNKNNIGFHAHERSDANVDSQMFRSCGEENIYSDNNCCHCASEQTCPRHAFNEESSLLPNQTYVDLDLPQKKMNDATRDISISTVGKVNPVNSHILQTVVDIHSAEVV